MSVLAAAWLAMVGVLSWVTTEAVASRRLGALAVPAPQAGPHGWRPRGVRGRARLPVKGRREAAARADAARAAESLVPCLRAGCSVVAAAAEVGARQESPQGRALGRAAELIRLGADPVATWRGLSEYPGMEALGAVLARSCASGTPVADALAEHVDQQRARRRCQAEAAVARVGVLAAAPLGLCFLPAFLCLGVAPTVIGLAGAGLTTP